MTTQTLSTSSPSWPDGRLPGKWVNALFNKMAFAYGSKFADMWSGVDSAGLKQYWAQKLGVLTRDDLERGVQALDKQKWPPTLGEFMLLCRPPVDPVVAFHEALEQGQRRGRGDEESWTSPAIFWAWRKIGSYDFEHLPYAVLRQRWEAALAHELGKSNIEPIPPQAVALPAPGKTLMASAKARELLASLKVKSVGQTLDPTVDGKLWARVILEKRERGEPVGIAQVEAAEKALGLR